MSQQNIKEENIIAPEELIPVFEEAQNVDETTAVEILLQIANFAQRSGILSVRDSVMLAAAVNVLRPGTI